MISHIPVKLLYVGTVFYRRDTRSIVGSIDLKHSKTEAMVMLLFNFAIDLYDSDKGVAFGQFQGEEMRINITLRTSKTIVY
jgi:hypothetical protein